MPANDEEAAESADAAGNHGGRHTPPARRGEDEAESADAPLAQRLRERIRRAGALTFDEWMGAALYDPREGYYCRRDRARWGRAGDYRTSPETSPLFAAAFAGYFAALREELGAPKPFTILEAGSGAADFARGVLETLRDTRPDVFNSTRYLIDEASEDARARALSLLAPFAERVEFRRLDELPDGSLTGVVFSNELLDALPVKRVRMRGGRLLELCVGLDGEGRFAWVEREPESTRLSEYFAGQNVTLAEGQAAEVGLAAEDWLARAAAVLRAGYVVTVDYGAEAAELYGAPHRREGTLRAFRGHTLSDDVLARPGEQDLTATVNWTRLRGAGERAGLRTILLARQDDFLLRAGLLEHLERLTDRLPDEAAKLSLRLTAREMILPTGMGRSFQVLVQEKAGGRGPGR